jgi:hypothetical protein
MICSNSGFTSGALRKAARMGLLALAALIEGEKRIRVVVCEQIYTRIVEFLHHAATFHHPDQDLPNDVKGGLARPHYKQEWTYHGKSVEARVAGKLLEIAAPATRSRSFFIAFRFRESIGLDIRGFNVWASGIDIRAAFSVQWMTQVAEIGASQGMYDYLRQVVALGPGPYQFHIKNVNTQTWGTPVGIEDVPPRLLIPFDQRQTPDIASMEMTLAMVKNMPQSDPKYAPDLDPFIVSKEIVGEEED